MKTRNIVAFAITVTFGIAVTAQADIIAWYPFDTDYSDTVGANDGTATGDAALAGPFTGVDGVGGAAQFSGAGHVTIPIDINPAVVPDMTVTMWVKADASIVGASSLYKTFGHDDGGWDRTFGLDNRDNGVFRWAAFNGGAGPAPTPATSTPVTDGWTFLAAVWDTDSPTAGSNTVTFYTGLPGEVNDSITRPLINTPSVHTTSAIGNLRPDNFNEGWVGLIDNVTIHNAALSVEEINQWKAVTGAVPEPSSMALTLLAGMMLLGVRRW